MISSRQLKSFAELASRSRAALFPGDLDAQGRNIAYGTGPSAILLTLACARRSEKRTEDVAGFIPNADAVVELPFATARRHAIVPAAGDRLTHTPSGELYRVAVIMRPPGAEVYRLQLELIKNV